MAGLIDFARLRLAARFACGAIGMPAPRAGRRCGWWKSGARPGTGWWAKWLPPAIAKAFSAQRSAGTSASGSRNVACQRSRVLAKRNRRREIRVLVRAAARRVELQHQEVTGGAQLDLEVPAAGPGEEALDHVVLPEVRDPRAPRRVGQTRRTLAFEARADLEPALRKREAQLAATARIRTAGAVPVALDREPELRGRVRNHEHGSKLRAAGIPRKDPSGGSALRSASPRGARLLANSASPF